jgi:hypothetical protein
MLIVEDMEGIMQIVGCYFLCEDGHNDALKHVETEVNNKHLIVASCCSSLFIRRQTFAPAVVSKPGCQGLSQNY